ncbi:hypothetical protein V6N13_059634 [Hibiscus sabdariffa]
MLIAVETSDTSGSLSSDCVHGGWMSWISAVDPFLPTFSNEKITIRPVASYRLLKDYVEEDVVSKVDGARKLLKGREFYMLGFIKESFRFTSGRFRERRKAVRVN